ncbi:MAG: hypothetical protein AAFX86_03965 [Pseudomonadota bacterium]
MLVRTTGFLVQRDKLQSYDPLPLEAFKVRIKHTGDVSFFREDPEQDLRRIARDALNHLNQMAYGVRSGQLDYQTLNMVIRSTYVRYACRYAELIKADTGARPCPFAHGRLQGTLRSYEHFLWLVMQFDILKSDNVDIAHIVLPPKEIVRD